MDGITSGTIIYHYLQELDPEVDITYFFHDGKQHGLEDSWEKFINAEISILLQPDSGINDYKYHDLLGESNIQTVVLDHHEYENGGFSKYAIYVDNQISNEYTNKNLAGCGVTWQCCRMIDILNNTNFAFKYIDLVALGCASDVMSTLSPENRYIYEYGFSHIQDKAFRGLCNKQAYSMGNAVNYTSVAFYIAPLINACMRTGTAEEKLLMYKMFLHPDREVISDKRGAKGETVNIIEECTRVLSNVKNRQGRLIDKYTELFDGRIAEFGLDDNNIIIIQLTDEDDFESELNGLIAMKCAAQYHKPCLVLRSGPDGESKGSMRNPNGSPIESLKDLIAESPYTTFVAGHANAAGCGIKTEFLDKFIEWFNEKTADLHFNINCYEVNFLIGNWAELPLFQEICWDCAKWNDIWGGDNPQPIIGLEHIMVSPDKMQFMGTKKDTIKMNIGGVNCMIFKNPELVTEWASVQKPIDVKLIGRPSINEWNGTRTIQLMVDDIEWEYADEAAF